MPIVVSGLRETVGWLLEPAFLAISVKVVCLGVLKVGDNRWYTRIEPRFRRNEIGLGGNTQQLGDHIENRKYAVAELKISSSKKNVVRILNFQIIFCPGGASLA